MDHEPPHVHVIYGSKKTIEKAAKIEILTGNVIENNGFSAKDLKRIGAVIKSQKDHLKEIWDEYKE